MEESSQLLTLEVFQRLPVAVVAVDGQGEVELMNARARALLGEGRPGQSLCERFGLRRRGGGACDDDDLPAVRVLREVAPIASNDFELVDERGSIVPLATIAEPIVDAEGRRHGVAVFWDARRDPETDRDQSLLAAVVESTEFAIVTVDLEGIVTSWNRGAERTYGFSEAEAVGQRLTFLLPDEDHTRERAWAAVVTGEEVAPAEVVRTRRDGARIVVEESLSPLRGPAGATVGVASLSKDVTLRREVESALAATRRELEQKNDRLERSNRDLEQFAYVASHDLSEPLRAVSGMVQLLARRYQGKLDADADEFIAFAIDGCTRMKALIDDVLLYSRAGRADVELVEVDLGAVARDVVSALDEAIAESGAAVVVGPLPTVLGDRNAYTQVLQNLVSNALKFRRPDVAPVVEVRAARDSGAWIISVADNGIGIDPQYRSRIFRMFQRLHGRDEYPGTGIGLAIAERLVSRFGGRMAVDERPGGGSVFTFTVPDVPEVLG